MVTEKIPDTKTPEQHQLRMLVETFYDLQKMRLSSKNRSRGEDDAAFLDDADKAFMGSMGDGLHDLEKRALRHVTRLLKVHPIHEWLASQKGVGPTMAGVIIASYDITRASTASKMWKYTGLTPGQRRTKGKRLDYNPWLKTKMVGVLANCMVKAWSLDDAGYFVLRGLTCKGCKLPKTEHCEYCTAKTPPEGGHCVHRTKIYATTDDFVWRSFYDNYRHRKASQIGECMLCEGTGYYVGPKTADKELALQLTVPDTCLRDNGKDVDAVGKLREKHRCSNCDGTGRGPWGRSAEHRSQAAKRYMIKMFLLELHKVWRGLGGLPVRPSYQEQYLGHRHTG